MVNNQPNPSGREQLESRPRFSRLASLPIPLLLVAMAALWLADLRAAYESPFLLLVLNFVLSMLASFFIAYLVGRSFLVRRTPGLLLLGCGVIAWGAAGLVGVATGILGATAGQLDINLLITIHNLSVWLSGLCHLAGAACSLRPKRQLRAAGLWLTATYALTLGAVGLVTLSALAHWTPTFFVQGQGGTPVRLFVLGSATAMFVLSAALLGGFSRKPLSPFVHWYTLALALIAVGLFGIMIESVHASALSWTGRAAQFLGGIYMFIAALASVRGSRVWGIALETALRQSEERLTFALETSHTGAWELDLRDHTAHRSLEHDRIFGYPALLPQWNYEMFLEHVLPEDRPVADSKFRRAVETGGDWNFECRIRRPDQQVRWIWAVGRHRIDAAGVPQRMMGIVQDITERKRGEEALEQSARQFRTLADSIPNLAWWANSDGYLTWYNRRWYEYTGTTPEQMEGWGWQSVHDPQALPAVLERWRTSIATGEPFDMTFPLRGADGVFRPFLTRVMPLKNAQGHVQQWFGTNTDVSEQKQAEETVRQLNAELRQRVSELQTASEEGQASRRAALSLAEDALEARQAVERVNAELQKANESLSASRRAALNMRDDAVLARNQTEQAKEELQRLNRTLKAHSKSDQALLRAQDEAEYLAAVCRIVVEDCGHAMVWVGFAEDDKARMVRPAAQAGFEEGYLETLHITWANTERGRGPTGTAIRTGQPSLCRNMLTDPAFAPWREDAVKRGYASSLVLPLLADGRAFGALTIYSKQTDAFGNDEVKLLTDLAGDLAYGISALRVREAKDWAEEALRKTNEELEQRVAARTTALRASERYARSLLEASLDPLVTISTEGKITDVNLATEHATGVGRERLVGSDFALYFTEPERAEAGYRKVLQEGAVSDYPLTIRHVTGRTTDVLYNASVYRGETGEVRGVFAAARDITQRKEAERRRDFTNSLLSLFASKSTANDYLNSVVEIIRQWSGCQALGIRLKNGQQEIPYESWAGFEPGFLELERRLSLEHDNCLCIRAIAGECEAPDRALLTPGGSFRADDAIGFAKQLSAGDLTRYRGNCMKFGFASLAIIPIRYREKIIGALHLADRRPGWFPLATVEFIESITPLIGEAVQRFQTEAELARHRDHLEELVKQRTGQLVTTNARLELEVAERRLAQEKLLQAATNLERSNSDLEQFAYVASHDLQEPLRAVGGYVKLLQRRFPESVDAKAREYIAGAADGAARMERLITDLLTYSRVGSRGGAFLPNDLNVLLKEVLYNLQPSIKNARAQVTSDPLPTLAVDATQMRQLFQNLIANALKFRAEAPPRIHIGAQPQEGRWVISVRDNGIGIEPQFFERIFQIFQRLHTRKYYPGTGIGLAICKKIAERHGGALWVESQPGQGSTFYFSIPQLSDPTV